VSSSATTKIAGFYEYGFARVLRISKKIACRGGVAQHRIHIETEPNTAAEYNAGVVHKKIARAILPNRRWLF